MFALTRPNTALSPRSPMTPRTVCVLEGTDMPRLLALLLAQGTAAELTTGWKGAA
jgi:hypothetical protein